MADLVDALEDIADRHEAKLAQTLEKAMRSASARYVREDVLALPNDFRGAIEKRLVEMWTDSTREAGQRVVQEFRSYGFAHLETKQQEETLWDEIVQAFLARFGAAKVTRIVEATRDQLLRIVQRGQREGMTLPEIGAAMRAVIPDLSKTRAHTIARTETHTSGTHATHEVVRTSRRPMLKTWRATNDARTRDFADDEDGPDEFSHRAMDGVTLPMAEPFMVPTIFGTREPLEYPGDPTGSAGNVINCRCQATYRRAEE